jgi:hypothetical protein
MMGRTTRIIDRKESYRIWGKYIFLFCFSIGLIISIYVGSIYWISSFAIAILVIWFSVPNRNEASENVSGIVSLIHSELKNSLQPDIEFRTIILRIQQKGKLREEGIVKILESFAMTEDNVGIEARKMLKVIQEN